jgi:hypothetical protein
MSEEELKRKIDELIGIESRKDGEALFYESPTGVLLFILYTFNQRVIGYSCVLPNLWRLLRIERSGNV